MKIRRGGVLRDVVSAYVFHLGSRKRIQTIKQLRGGSLVTIASFIQPLSVTASDTSNSPTFGATTKPSTCTVTGGAPAYSYSWVRLSGVPATINSPASASTTFTFSGEGSATFRVTVTDGQGKTATATMTANWFAT